MTARPTKQIKLIFFELLEFCNYISDCVIIKISCVNKLSWFNPREDKQTIIPAFTDVKITSAVNMHMHCLYILKISAKASSFVKNGHTQVWLTDAHIIFTIDCYGCGWWKTTSISLAILLMQWSIHSTFVLWVHMHM